ncbi:hypothetical protein Prudu_1184S000100 [Prunus dulcis]|uniref:Ubiquitin-like protease family profile domain-containing protein n=1 Tax=Prunus dulcis TaxID=3755 RepID=A0A5H2XPG1_PRUDU|nr:hypothetical protein Prudu_1184S000100 [Prunus dulcis]
MWKRHSCLRIRSCNLQLIRRCLVVNRDTFLLPEDITQFAGMEEIGATVVAVYMRYLHDVLKTSNMCSMVGFIDPATVSANSGTIADRSRLVAARLQKTDGEQIFMMPYNPGRHWVLLIVRAKRETVYFLDPLPGTPKQPSSVNAGIIDALHEGHHHGSFLGFENKYAKGNQEASYPKKQLMKSGMNGQSLFAKLLNRGILNT